MNNSRMGAPVEILLVEDNPGDVRLAREALKENKVSNNLHVIEDGESAMAFLRKQGKYQNATRPDLILLDLNLPKKDGREVLAEIKADDRLKAADIIAIPDTAAATTPPTAASNDSTTRVLRRLLRSPISVTSSAASAAPPSPAPTTKPISEGSKPSFER